MERECPYLHIYVDSDTTITNKQLERNRLMILEKSVKYDGNKEIFTLIVIRGTFYFHRDARHAAKVTSDEQILYKMVILDKFMYIRGEVLRTGRMDPACSSVYILTRWL